MVSARRLRIDSAVMPGCVERRAALKTAATAMTDASLVGSETDVRIFRLMRPGDSTTGLNSRPMPYSSFSIA